MSQTYPLRRTRMAALAAAATIAVALGALVAAPAQAAQSAGVASGPCVRALPVGTSTLGVSYAGESFDVQVHVPAAPAGKKLPLVLDLHASGGNPVIESAISGLAAVADEEGFILATPQGDIPFGPTAFGWNVPGVPLVTGIYPAADARDDVGFLRALVQQIDSRGCVDPRQVYAAGVSGGARMASALACEASDVFAAIGTVAGLRAGRSAPTDFTVPAPGTCQPERPVAVVAFHGTADQVNPYLGNTDLRWGYSVQVAAQTWANINGCRPEPQISQYSNAVRQYSWTKCAKQADVTVYEVAGGGHTWPGSDVDFTSLGLGENTQEIDASQVMWDFFDAHRRRG